MPLNKIAHREYYKEYSRARRRAGDLNFVTSSMLANAKSRSRKRGMEFDITKEYLLSIWPDECPVLGIAWNFAGTKKDRYGSPSLDRIDNSKGYVPGNVRIISTRANMIKTNLTYDEVRLLYENFHKVR